MMRRALGCWLSHVLAGLSNSKPSAVLGIFAEYASGGSAKAEAPRAQEATAARVNIFVVFMLTVRTTEIVRLPESDIRHPHRRIEATMQPAGVTAANQKYDAR